MAIVKTKILVCVNTLTDVNKFAYANHIAFFTHAFKDNSDIDIIFMTPTRMAIDSARNWAAKQALELEADYLMFLDDDVLVPPHALKMLLDSDKDIVAGLVIIRGYPFEVMAFRFKGPGELALFSDLPMEPFVWTEDELKYASENGMVLPTEKLAPLVPVDAVGFSCCLIKMDVIKKMKPPYFMTGFNHTEDVYFCLKALRTEGLNPSIYLNTEIQCGHLLDNEPVEWSNRAKLKEYYLSFHKEQSRNENFVLRNIARLGK